MGELRAFDRHTAIVDYLRLYERASTRQLSRHFGVSEVTIRSDLASLERDGWLVRRHGGAELARTDQGEQLFAERHSAHRLAKAEIARAAAELVTPDTTILLDASTTTYQLALEIRDRRNLTIITNNLPAATLLSENPSLEVILIGGQIRGGVGSVVGVLAEEMLAKLHAARGFFGAAGLTLDRGLTDADLREVQIKRAMIAAVDEVAVLLDASKFGRQALLTFADLKDVDYLVTEHHVPPAYAAACADHTVKLITV